MKYNFKQLAVYTFLFFTLIFFVSVWMTRTAHAASGSFALSPATVTVGVNQETTITVTINTGGANSPGSDLVLTYTPGVISVVDVLPGTVFNTYFPKTIDDAAGRATISAITSPGSPLFNGTGTFAMVRVKGVAGGTSPLAISFTPGNANDSNIADDTPGMPQDVLTSVTNATVTVPGTGGQPTNTPVPGQPTITPRPPTNTPLPHQPTNTPRPPGTGGGASDDDDDRDEPGDDDFDKDRIDNNTDDDDDNDGIKDKDDDDDDNDGIKNDKDDDDDNDGVNDGYDTNEDRRSANKHLRTQGKGSASSGSLIAIILASIGYAVYWIRNVLGSVFK